LNFAGFLAVAADGGGIAAEFALGLGALLVVAAGAFCSMLIEKSPRFIETFVRFELSGSSSTAFRFYGLDIASAALAAMGPALLCALALRTADAYSFFI